MGGRGAPRGVSRIHLRPSGHDFFSFRGIAGRADRIFGNDGPSKTHWRFKLQLDCHFLKLPLIFYGDLRLQKPLPARGAESVVAYLLFDDPACRLVVSGCSGFRPRAGLSGSRDLKYLIVP